MSSKRVLEIQKVCRGKSVLDIGCVDHSANTEKNDIWLHKKIKLVAKDLVGLDYEKKEIEKLNKKGYNIIYGDAENFDLGRKFDVIVAGELIEHLFNPGRFLDSVKRHMHKNSILIFTTPNAFAYRRMIGSFFWGSLKENVEHVAYYSDTTVKQLLLRKGFKNVEIKYLESEDKICYKYIIEKFLNLLIRNSNKTILLVYARV